MALELSLGSQIYLASSSGAVWIDDAEEGRKEGRKGRRYKEKRESVASLCLSPSEVQVARQ